MYLLRLRAQTSRRPRKEPEERKINFGEPMLLMNLVPQTPLPHTIRINFAPTVVQVEYSRGKHIFMYLRDDHGVMVLCQLCGLSGASL
jgi:hypothetical protein